MSRFIERVQPTAPGIVGRIEGQGPPVVFVHGILSDGETLAPLARCLADSFTCYLMSTRGRGMSEKSLDLSGQRRVEDVLAFTESIGEPVGLVGHSLGGRIALDVAARSNRVSAVAAFDPAVLDVLGEEGTPDLGSGIRQMAEIAQEGRLTDAAAAFFAQFISDSELSRMRESGVMERAGELVPLELQGLQQDRDARPPALSTTIAKVTVPILLLKGEGSSAWFHRSVPYVEEHASLSEVRVIEGGEHFAPVFDPEPVAAEIRRSLGSGG